MRMNDLRQVTAEPDRERYIEAHTFLGQLTRARLNKLVTAQQYRTLRGQALAGDIEGARKGLEKLTREWNLRE